MRDWWAKNAIGGAFVLWSLPLLLAASLAACAGINTQPAAVSQAPGTTAVVTAVLPAVTPTTQPTPQLAAAPTAIPSTPAPTTAPEAAWERRAIGPFWDVAVPPGWTVDDAGATEGAARLAGSLDGRTYAITLAFPIGIGAATLEEWVDVELAPQGAAVTRRPATIAGAPALLVLGAPPPQGVVAEHRAYIWRNGSTNPRLVTAAQLDGPADPTALEALLVRFLGDVGSPQ
ncbi:MAG: hypothetical protein OHK0022_12710 [Roseiflexaceae bacterium]